MGYKLTWVYMRPNGTEQKIRPVLPPYSPDITTATQDQSVQPTYISNNRCIEVSSDGCHILLTHENWPVYEHTLSIPFDLTSTITSQTANLLVWTYTNCVVYSDDGSYIYVSDGYGWGQTAYITQRALSTPFDISTAWAVIKTSPWIPWTADHWIWWFRFYDNWTKIIGAYRSGYIVSATLSTAWDISTMWTITVQTTQAQYWNYWQWFAISPTWMDCYMVSEYESDIAQLTTTNAYDFSNATKTTRSASLSWNKFWIKVTDDGKYCFIATQNWTIYRYSFQEL